jgi:hypothetical protein
MKITLHTYEHYALDYLEETLSEESQKAFDAFLVDHPEIAAQIRELQSGLPTLTADPSVRFDGKAALRRPASLRTWFFRAGVAAAVLLLGVWLVAEYHPGAIEPDRLAANHPTTRATAKFSAIPVPTPHTMLSSDLAHAPATISDPTPTIPDPQPDPPTEMPPAPRSAVRHEIEVPLIAISRPEYPKMDPGALPSAAEAEALIAALDPDLFEFEPSLPEPEPIFAAAPAYRYFNGNNEQLGLLNVLHPQGFKRFVSGILTPISGLNPISAYENRNEKVVEFASVPIHRRHRQPLKSNNTFQE